MTWAGTEYLRYAPRENVTGGTVLPENVRTAVAVGSQVFAANNRGEASIFRPSDQVSASWNASFGINGATVRGSIVWCRTSYRTSTSYGGGHNDGIAAFDMSSGANTETLFVAGGSPAFVPASELASIGASIYSRLWKFNRSTSTFTGWADLGRDPFTENPRADGSLLMTLSGASLRFHNTSDGSVASSVTLATAPLVALPARLGDVLWFPTASATQVGYNVVTATPVVRATSPSGMPAPAAAWVAHSDGFLYAFSASNKLLCLDPATGRWKADTLPVSRATRYPLVSVGGELWTAAVEPTTW